MRVDAIIKAKKEFVEQDEVSEDLGDHIDIDTNDGILSIIDLHRDDRNSRYQVELEVALPWEMSVKTTHGVGSLSIGYASGTLDLKVSVGSVHISAKKVDTIRAVVGTGSIHLASVSVQDDVEAVTDVGDILVLLPRSEGGRFAMEAGVGSIHVDDRTDLEVSRRSLVGSSASGTIGRGGTKYVLRTGVGTVSIKSNKTRSSGKDSFI